MSTKNAKTSPEQVMSASTGPIGAPVAQANDTAPVFNRSAVHDAAAVLATADASFESAMLATATAVAGIMGTEPTYDLWTSVASAFQTDYAEARKCKVDTAQKRWFSVVAAMEAEFALEKPAKPTKAAEVKAAQREGAAAEAAAIIAKAQATTPAAILALTSGVDGQPLKPAVIAAIAKQAGAVATDGAKEANDAARQKAKDMREEIRKGLSDLSVAQLETVRTLVASFKPVAPAAPITPAPQPEGQQAPASA